MKYFTRNFLMVIISTTSFIGLTSFILLKTSYVFNTNTLKEIECEEEEPASQLLTSTGDVLGFYTTLTFLPGTFPIEVVSFPAFTGGATTLQGPWSTPINFTMSNVLLPTNATAYNPVQKELVCLISSEQQLLEYEDVTMTTPNPFNLFPNTPTAPAYLNGTYYAILVENSGFADAPLYEADIVGFDYQTATFSSYMHLSYPTGPNTSEFNHQYISSATNRTNELYFLCAANLVVITNLSVFTPAYCWIDLAPANTPNNYVQFYGLEYKSPGILLAIRETHINGAITAVELVEININSTLCSVNSITVVYDLKNNFMPSPVGFIVNIDYYSTTYDTCRQLYYLSTVFSPANDSRLVEIDIQNATHSEQILPQYLFGIEWKHQPCPCKANFVYQQFSSCDQFNFINTSTGSAGMTCHWDFGDPNSAPNNTSSQCNEQHQFSTCGNFLVCLTISANGCTDNFCQTITTVTDNVPPVAQCRNSVIKVLDANCMAFLQPSEIDLGSSDDCTLKSLSVSQSTFTACGNYPVTLTATDWCGNTSQCNTIVQVVDNLPPVIICPNDVSLSIPGSSCSMIVNGLQWIALADNCGMSSITYTVSGDTQHSGVGDASGLLFNDGTSFVTYTVTDNCGNSTQCSFKVELSCFCNCPNNLVQNPGFGMGAVIGHLNAGGSSNNWSNGPWGDAAVVHTPGCCDPYFIEMYGGTNNGESMFQQGFSFVAGHQYRISFCGNFRTFAGSGTNVRFGFNATNSPTPPAFNPFSCTNCEPIGSSPSITTAAWNTYTLPIWTPTQNWNTIYIRTFSNSFGVGRIDNICITEVPIYKCCEDEVAFIENAGNAISIYLDSQFQETVFEIGNMFDCNQASFINWGDGTDTVGPIGGNNQLRHTYPDSKPYQIQYEIQEIDQNDTSQVCFQHIFTDSSQVRIARTKYKKVKESLGHEEQLGIWYYHYVTVCYDSGKRTNVENTKFNLQTAMLRPLNFEIAEVNIVNELSQPVITKAGEVISLFPSNAVTEKISHLSPPPDNYVWEGFESNLITPTDSPSEDSSTFYIDMALEMTSPGVDDSEAAFWLSDNKGDLYGELIIDSYTKVHFPPPVPGTIYSFDSYKCLFKPDGTLNCDGLIKRDDTGGRLVPVNSYHMQAAVMQPSHYSKPAVTLLDLVGNPYQTELGETVQFLENLNVTEKIQNLYPSPNGYSWIGFKSNLLSSVIDSHSTKSQYIENIFWDETQTVSLDSNIIMWFSDDKDDILGEYVRDAFVWLDSSLLDTTTSILHKEFPGKVFLHPNPTSGDILMELPLFLNGTIEIKIIDYTGHTVQETNCIAGTKRHLLLTKNLLPGLYYVQVLSEGQVIYVDKFIKM